MTLTTEDDHQMSGGMFARRCLCPACGAATSGWQLCPACAELFVELDQLDRELTGPGAEQLTRYANGQLRPREAANLTRKCARYFVLLRQARLAAKIRHQLPGAVEPAAHATEGDAAEPDYVPKHLKRKGSKRWDRAGGDHATAPIQDLDGLHLSGEDRRPMDQLGREPRRFRRHKSTPPAAETGNVESD